MMIYWHVERKNVCIYSQLTSCSSSEVAAMIEGLLRHCTDTEIHMALSRIHGGLRGGHAPSLVQFALVSLRESLGRRSSTASGAPRRRAANSLSGNRGTDSIDGRLWRCPVRGIHDRRVVAARADPPPAVRPRLGRRRGAGPGLLPGTASALSPESLTNSLLASGFMESRSPTGRGRVLRLPQGAVPQGTKNTSERPRLSEEWRAYGALSRSRCGSSDRCWRWQASHPPTTLPKSPALCDQ